MFFPLLSPTFLAGWNCFIIPPESVKSPSSYKLISHHWLFVWEEIKCRDFQDDRFVNSSSNQAEGTTQWTPEEKRNGRGWQISPPFKVKIDFLWERASRVARVRHLSFWSLKEEKVALLVFASVRCLIMDWLRKAIAAFMKEFPSAGPVISSSASQLDPACLCQFMRFWA